MSITPADIKTRYPEFTGVDDTRIQFFIDDAALYLNEARAGCYYNKLLSLLTAHYLALANESADGVSSPKGTPNSYSVGDTSISFANRQMANASDYYFNQTTYGAEFLTWLTYTGGGGMIV